MMNKRAYDKATIGSMLRLLRNIEFHRKGDIWTATLVGEGVHGSGEYHAWRYLAPDGKPSYEPISYEEHTSAVFHEGFTEVDPADVYNQAMPLFMAALTHDGIPGEEDGPCSRSVGSLVATLAYRLGEAHGNAAYEEDRVFIPAEDALRAADELGEGLQGEDADLVAVAVASYRQAFRIVTDPHAEDGDGGEGAEDDDGGAVAIIVPSTD